MTHNDWREQLPFYVAGTMSDEARTALEGHLRGCSTCPVEVREWQRVAVAVRREADARVTPLPPLSPVVRANLRRYPTTGEAILAAAHLIRAQWSVLRGLLLVALLVLLLVLLGTMGLHDDSRVALPLLALAPIVAALSVAFLHHPEADPAWEMVAASPTPLGSLVFARLTLILGLIVCVMLAGSLAISVVTGQMVGTLVAVWLGPLLLLSALATVLAILWSPATSAATCLTLWAALVVMLARELSGAPLLTVSLQPLLAPGWLLFCAHLAGALALWSASYRLTQGQPLLWNEVA